VALAARSPEPLKRVASELSEASGRKVIGVPADTASDASVESMVAAVTAEMGGIDVLVNAAAVPGGGSQPPPLSAITDEMFFDDMNVKVMGYLRCARAVAPLMRRSGWGRIVNISGLAARQSGSTIGSMRNVAVAALTKNLADELGPHGINVTVVHPGLTWTERMPELIVARAREEGRPYEEVLQDLQRPTR
jgi:NAD(P)-dependent dehydrogenase (short-subunit alcohol dehydrogenase family)